MLIQSVLIWCRRPCHKFKIWWIWYHIWMNTDLLLSNLEHLGAIVYTIVEPRVTMNWIAEMIYLESGWECKIQKISITGYSFCRFRLAYLCAYPVMICTLFLLSPMTVYIIPMTIILLTHSSHDHVLFSHDYSSFDSSLSQPCTVLSQLLHYDSLFPYLRTVYIEPGIHCKCPNLALLKYTWVSGQVPLGSFVFDISFEIYLCPSSPLSLAET